mmetsp:Transcript_7324/g.9776  ORF Transcript_7324/g.9776 Transcript_7324/m.9776 type:complete len:605 (-) Transcript_7324:103-1917(-)
MSRLRRVRVSKPAVLFFLGAGSALGYLNQSPFGPLTTHLSNLHHPVHSSQLLSKTKIQRCSQKTTPIICYSSESKKTAVETETEIIKTVGDVSKTIEDIEIEQEQQDIKLIEPFGVGVMSDIKKKLPLYKSDFRDGFSMKCLSAIVFLFFGCIAPAVAFGGVVGVMTEQAIGSIEMVLSTAICGMIYSLFSGQPLTIIGSTGPVLAFTGVLYKTCKALSLPFLAVYGWVGLWSSAILLACSLFSTSNVVDYFTRFTDEIFSLLISVIFIMEASKDLVTALVTPAVPIAQGLTTLVLAATTYVTAIKLKGLRKEPFFSKRIRETVSDFAPSLGVAAGVIGAALLRLRNASNAAFIPTLKVPLNFATSSGRPWLVNLFELPVNMRLLCFFPAIMASILLFMDQNITTHLVNSPQNKLKKGKGMHLDLFVLSILTAGCSIFGLPWLVAATVRSVAHLNGLKTMSPDGEHVEKVEEQRLTGFTIHALIFTAIVFARPALSKIPMSVLMGLFMYLGTSSLQGNQMFERTKLFITDPKRKPKFDYTSKLPLKTTNKFTAIQMASLAAMYGMKSTPLGVLFPVLIALLAPIRFSLEKFKLFTKEELAVLDS